MESNINKPYKGLHTDNHPSEQPKETYRYALNSVNENSEGEQTSLSNEGANYACTSIPTGYTIIGDRYLEDNTTVVFSVSSGGGRGEIGLLRKNNTYTTLVNSASLNFNIRNQVDATYRLRRGNERVIYWVDGLNKPRSLNIDKLYNYYTETYKNYLELGGDPDLFTGEKWDMNSFDLVKSYTKIPYFFDVEVLDYGSVDPGSYNFAIQYIDEDLNPTEWINVSNTVNIYNSSLDSPYESIRGSYNNNDYQKFPIANKSIKLSLTNIDSSYPYYRIAIIQAKEGTGSVTNVLVSSPQSSNVGVYIYSGNDSAMESIDVNEIRFEKENILKPRHIEQLENRLILANTEGQDYNWCEFQKYASRIDTDLITKNVILNSVQSEPNVKNGKSTFFFRGYMPGDLYSFGIVYIMKDMSLSPVFHIPGKSEDNVSSSMGVYRSNYTYPDIHNCGTGSYWGVDAMGNQLLGQPVRHHKFPTRKEANIPLITTTESTVNYRRFILRLKVTLKPGETYPVDTGGNPIIIGYQANYQVTGNPISSYINTFSESQLGIPITILDITLAPPDELVEIDPPNYFELDPSSEIIVDHSDKFDFEYMYEERPDDTVTDATQSQIFGIEFSGIDKPHSDVVGFYIVRHQATDEDKLVVDNCIIGPNIKEQNYRAFTHITPAFTPSRFDDRSVWFFSPEVNFKQKLVQFNDIDVQGYYEATSIQTPSQAFYADEDSSALNGVYIEDVQAGTSYNPEVHKKREKDSDGFSLHIGYKTTMFNYIHTPLTLGRVSNAFVLSAATNKLVTGTNYFNVSTDNKISMATFSGAFTANIFQHPTETLSANVTERPLLSVPKSRLIYATLRKGYYDDSNTFRDMDYSYQDFITRPYYKEHMRPVFFGLDSTYNGFQLYNGDVQISGMNFLTTMFRQLKMEERRNKVSVWKYIVGAVLIVAGAVLAYFTGGVSLAAAISGASALIGAGAMFIHSGIKLDKAIAMFDEHYSKGLLKCVEDDVVINQLGSPEGGPSTGDPNRLVVGDDCIQWFSDRAANIYIESRVPFGLRAGVTVDGVTDFIDGPGPYNDSVMYNYLTEKLTYFDREQGGGRMYRGVANAEVYSMNPDYSRFNLEKSYIHLPSTYDCCNEGSMAEKFPTRVWYSQQSFQEELTDNYRSFLPNNYRDVEGENGEITDLYKIGNSLFIHTNEALWNLPQNIQERVSNELTTYIGTGEFFSIPPVKVLDDTLGSGGSKHKWATVKTRYGVFFVSEVENKVYLHSEGLKEISLIGLRNWFENNLKPNLVEDIYNYYGVDYHLDNNPANPVGVGYLATYDTRYNRVLFTKRDYKLLQELETINTPVADLTPPVNPYLYTKVVLNLYYNEFWRVDVHEGGVTRNRGSISSFDDYPEIFENKSFTMSYSFHTNSWVSYHSYLPNYYIGNQSSLYSFIAYNNNIWKHNMEDKFMEFYEDQYPHIIEYVSNSNPLITRTWEDITFLTTAKRWDADSRNFVDERYITHNKITLSNSRQCSGELEMIVKDITDVQDYLFEQVKSEPGQILIDRNERNWNINNLRDYVIDYTKPFYSFNWDLLQGEYPIDKVLDMTVIDYLKDWTELESFRDKYLNIRLKFDNFANIKLSTQFSIEGEEISQR